MALSMASTFCKTCTPYNIRIVLKERSRIASPVSGSSRQGLLGTKVSKESFKSTQKGERLSLHTHAALAGDMEETFSLPPNELPTGKWERSIVQMERAFNVFSTSLVVKILDKLYSDRHYARFYVLETIARVPYFSFMSVLHTYESFGWWRRADYIKVHFAESWNEMHHLLIMEALGGDKVWIDRFLAQHISVAYYFATILMYLLSPRMAYHFSECVEEHAFSTYDKFLKQNGEELKKLPAPEVAVRYYTESDLYMFDEFYTSGTNNFKRPVIENLYDVFVAIRADEAEHCKTMRACQTPAALKSPHADFAATAPSCTKVEGFPEEVSLQCIVPPADCSGIIECALNSSSYADRVEEAKKASGN